MKKLLVLLLTAACALCLVFAVAGCKPNGGESSSGSNTQQGDTGDGHVHNYGNLIPEKSATCTEEGLQAHYYCSGCQTYFDGEKNETTLDELKIDVDSTAHNYGNLIPEKSATCTEEGLQAHYYCSGCRNYFDSEKQEKTLSELKIAPKGHTYGELILKQPATCTEEGLQAHYYCSGCQTYFDGEKNETTLDELKIDVDSTAHNYGELIPQVITNCENEGMQAYYHCEDCGKYFDDKKSEKSFNDLIIPAGHILEKNQVVCKTCGVQLAESLQFKLNYDNTYIILASGTPTSDGKIIIPKIYINLPVISIGDSAFWGCTSLTSITIPNSVTSIGNSAFYDCTSLTSITIPDSVTSIGSSAFNGCTNLTSVTIPDSVTSIGGYAFSDCTNLTSVTIPNSVTFIGEWAFYYCKSLESVTIPDSVITIGEWAFSYCKSLESITVAEDNTNYSSQDGVLYNKDKTELIQVPQAIKGSIAIPHGVTSIGEMAFNGCTSLESVTIPDSVTSIDDDAFSGCKSLASITIPDGVTSIGDGAFHYCTSLTEIIIPDSVTSIGREAFEDCTSLESIIIPDSITSISNGAFSWCTSLTEITIPESVTEIDRYAFYECTNLTIITISKSVTSIGNYAFSGCTSLESIIIPNSVTSIGGWAFNGCTSLTSITIPDSVTSIGGRAFSYCTSLKGVYITDIAAWCYIDFEYDANPLSYAHNLYLNNQLVTELTAEMLQGVTTIKDLAFYNCTSLTSVTIGNGVTSIEDNAFRNCTNLESITVMDNNTEYASQDGILYNKDKTEFILIPKAIKGSVIIPHSITSIGDSAFYDCKSLTEITIQNSVTSIEDNAFRNCTSLTSVTIGNGVTSIGRQAFDGCKKLTSITIPNSVTSIDSFAFNGCTSLKSVTFNNPNGWYCTKDSSATSGTDIPREDLQNPETAAKYLKDTYYNYYWKRKTT